MDNYQKRRNNNPRNNNMRGGRRYNNNRNQGGGQGGADLNTARQRRTAMAQREKYMNMARDALAGGDRVQAEYYFQHAEHYYRVIAALPPEDVPVARNYNNPQQGYAPNGEPGNFAPEGEAFNAPMEDGQAAPAAMPQTQMNRRPPQRQQHYDAPMDAAEPQDAMTEENGLPPFITGRNDEQE